jgi:enoyl-CoA hydratase/carnithine racemase
MIRCNVLGAVLEVEIHRPEKKNALTGEMYTGLSAAMDRAAGDAAVRAILITGTREVYCSGNDIADFLQRPPSSEASPVMQFLTRIQAAEKPIVAAVNGMAVGIGTTMLLHCDYVVAGEGASFSVPFVNLGLCSEAASSLLLPATIGQRRAAEMLLFGDRIDAKRALEWDLVNAVVADGEVLDTGRKRAQALAAKPADALRTTKALLKRHLGDAARSRMLEEGREFNRLLHEPAAREALTAFVEKRAPDPEKYK